MTRLQQAIRSAYDMTVVGAAFDGCDAISKSFDRSPAVVVVDVHLPGMDILGSTRRIKEGLPNVKVLWLGKNSTDSTLDWRSGADACLPKDCSTENLLIDIRALAAKGVTTCANIKVGQTLTRHGIPGSWAPTASGRQTDAERQIRMSEMDSSCMTNTYA
ncbi:MAG: response regulator [SAR202 cluster bacterium]|nr:response regulator [SAR202 cluster bacterium]